MPNGKARLARKAKAAKSGKSNGGYKFPPGNQFWKARSTHGRKPIFASPEQLEEACLEYFEWVDANPLYEAKAFAFQGFVTVKELPKLRAMTVGGLCLFLDISFEAWTTYKARPDFYEVVTWAEQTIRQQKFAGAAAELLNPNIIARDLGLSDKRELTGEGGGPIKTEDTTANDIGYRIASALRKAASEGKGPG